MEQKANWFGLLEIKYSKNKAFRWPLLLNDAKKILYSCLLSRNVEELENKTPLTLMVDEDFSEWGNYALFEETGFLLDELNRIDPFSKIREWSYENIICSALFVVLENDLKMESRFFFLDIINILCVHNDTVRQEVFHMLRRNGVVESNPQNFITDFIKVLEYERSYTFTNEGLFLLLELLSIEKAFILELLSKKDKNVLIHFLETFTYKSPSRLNFNELKHFLNSCLIKKKNKINKNYDNLKENLENFSFWDATCEWDDFGLSTQHSKFIGQFNFQEEDFKNFYITFLQLENYNLYKMKNLLSSKESSLYRVFEIPDDFSWEGEPFNELFDYDFLPFPLTKKNKNTINLFSTGIKVIAIGVSAIALADSRSLVHRGSQFQLDFGVVRQANTTQITALGRNESGIWAQSKPQALISASKNDQTNKLSRISTSTGLILPNFKKSVSLKGYDYWINSGNQLSCFGNVAAYGVNSKINGELRNIARHLGITPIISVHNADHPLPSGFGQVLGIRKSGSTVSVPEYVNKGRYQGYMGPVGSYKTPFYELAEQLMKSSELDFSRRLDTFIAKYPTYAEFKELIVNGYKFSEAETVNQIYDKLINIEGVPPNLTTPLVFYKLRVLYWAEDCEKLCNLPKQTNPENVKHAVYHFTTHLNELLEDGQITASLFKKGCDAWHTVDLESDIAKSTGAKALGNYVNKHKDILGTDFEEFKNLARECRSKDREIKKFVNKNDIKYLEYRHEKSDLGNMTSAKARLLYHTKSIGNIYPYKD